MSLNPGGSVGLGPMPNGGCKSQDAGLKACDEVRNLNRSQRSMERATVEGDSPVGETVTASFAILSTTGHEEPCGNPG